MASEDIVNQIKSAFERGDCQQAEEIIHRMEKAEQLRTEFLAMISHELRTPLNAIIGYNSMLEEEVYGALNEKQQKAVRRIDRNATRLLTLINQLLELSRLEAGIISVFHETTNLVEAVNEVLEEYQVLADEKGLALEIAHPRRGVEIVTDSSKVKEIIRQLVSNAIKFTNQGSIHIEIRPQDSGGLIRVSDTGVGIGLKQREAIFDLFHQGDAYPHRRQEGAGLGLAIVHRLARLLGASINLESEPEHGTTFTIVFPSLSESAAHPAPEPEKPSDTPAWAVSSAAAPVTPCHVPVEAPSVLIVDDDPYTVEILADYLEHRGHYKVQKAYSGLHAMIYLAEHRPDYLVVDLLMPQINGERVIQYCHELWGDKVSITVITGKELSREETRELETKVAAIIRKGDINQSNLAAALAAAIPLPAR